MKKAKVSEQLAEGACALCRTSVDNRERFGEIRTLDGVTIHYFCALFASGLYQNGVRETEGIWGFLLPDIQQEAKRARRLSCVFCKKEGASVGCLVGTCRTAFHFPCGLENNILNQYYGSFSSYCEKHRIQQTVPKQKKRMSTKLDECAICLCEVEPRPSNNVLIAPCCQNSFLHRECVQRHALSSGLHFFKCPLCNNKELFTDEMLKFGIYIPDQDASWEREDNAFVELLERHCACDVTNCLCEISRDYNELDSCWEIMLCDCCGSQGTHIFCSQLRTALDDWMCSSCSAVVSKESKGKEKKKHGKRRHSVSPVSRNMRHTSESLTPHSSTFLAEPEGMDQNGWHSTRSCLLEDSRSALSDVTSVLSNASCSSSVDRQLVQMYKPRPRCLSRYIQRHKTVRLPVSDNRPRWVKNLLNDDIHTGRNLGIKLSFMHTGETYDDEEEEEKDDGNLDETV